MDAFYASVEERDFPEYRGKPLVVGGQPDSRGVVATANYEARKYGIRSAMSCATAYRLCPQALFVKPRFEAYKEASLLIREVFHEYTDLVEPLSLDEAYLDVTEHKSSLPTATDIAKEIKQKIKARTQLTASAGVAPTKFLAKIASDLQKPDGLTVIKPHQMHEFLRKLPIGKFHGIGKVTESKMHSLGIFTGEQLLEWEERELIRHFGKTGRYYYKAVRGEDDREVRPERERKSVGAEDTFDHDTVDFDFMHTQLHEIAERVSRRLRKTETLGRTVTLKVRYDDFQRITRSITLGHFVDDAKELAELAISLLPQTEAGSRKIRLLGITVSNLNKGDYEEGDQLEFEFESDKE